MAHIAGSDRAQILLLPDTVDDSVAPDNPVRFIDVFVDSLDLAGSGFERAEPKETGRPRCDPADLLKLRSVGGVGQLAALAGPAYPVILLTWPVVLAALAGGFGRAVRVLGDVHGGAWQPCLTLLRNSWANQ